MSEPRYDFCLAVVREFDLIGYRLEHIFLLYTPDLPQEDRLRREWCEDRGIQQQILENIEECHDKRHHPKSLRLNASEDDDLGTLYLWGVVPILSVTKGTVFKKMEGVGFVREGKIVTDRTLYSAGLQSWFASLCEELYKKGGGKYLITNRKQSEVSKYAL